jgi:putative transposase
VVTDNGGPMRSIPVARWFAARPHFTHIRTRARSPQTNGVIERFFESLKYERLRLPLLTGHVGYAAWSALG